MRIEDAAAAPRAAIDTDPPTPRAAASTYALAGLGIVWMMSPFFLNPPLFVTLLGLPRSVNRR